MKEETSSQHVDLKERQSCINPSCMRGFDLSSLPHLACSSYQQNIVNLVTLIAHVDSILGIGKTIIV